MLEKEFCIFSIGNSRDHRKPFYVQEEFVILDLLTSHESGKLCAAKFKVQVLLHAVYEKFNIHETLYNHYSKKEELADSARDQLAQTIVIVYSGQSSQELSICQADISWR